MKVKDYCRSIEVELYGWKAKMYDMVRKVDKLRGSENKELLPRSKNCTAHFRYGAYHRTASNRMPG